MGLAEWLTPFLLEGGRVKGVRQIVAGGLRVKATWAGEYTSLLLQGAGGQTVFRGALMFSLWPKIKAALDSLAEEQPYSKTDFEPTVNEHGSQV